MAEEYELGRPEYPPAVAGALTAELGLRPGAAVLDLAAGTGKLSRALLAAGLGVVVRRAPAAPLRERLAASVGAERVLDGLAEAIPLPDGAVAAVTVADAIHWFDHARALARDRTRAGRRRQPRGADDGARLERGLVGTGRSEGCSPSCAPPTPTSRGPRGSRRSRTAGASPSRASCASRGGGR